MELTVDGRKVFATTGGRDFDPANPVIVFIHGASGTHNVWMLQTRYFAWHGYSVLALDMPGHGRSEGPMIDNIAGMADWVIAVLDAAGVEKAVLAGHSMGALVSLDAAARYPDRVARLALLGCAFPMRVNDDLLAAAKANDHIALDLTNSWGYGRAAQLGGHRVPGLWMMRGGLRIFEHSGKGVLFNDMNACNAYDDGTERAAAVACPTRFILGGKDMMTPVRAAKGLAEKIGNADVVVLPGIGHMMMEEAPDETLDALKDFVEAG
jgi:pimeloyl-ACP methyl ester carboxylesterase